MNPELVQELRVHQVELELQNEELQESQVRLEHLYDEYSGLYDSAPAGYLTLAPDGLVRKANQTAAAMLGVGRDSLLGTKLSRFVAPGDQDAFYKFRRAVCDKAQQQSHDFTFVRLDGAALIVHAVGRAVGNARRPVEVWNLVFTDISELVRTRGQLALLSKAINQNVDAILIADAAGTITYVNQRFTELTGYSWAEAVGSSPGILKSSETPRSVYEAMWRTIRAGGRWRADLMDRRKDGSRFWAHVTISPIRDDDGTVSHFVMTHEDITERKRLEGQVEETKRQLLHYVGEVERARSRATAQADSLVTMAGELSKQKEIAEQANRAKSEMLANVSHELRTPLNAIIGFADMMRHEILGPIGVEKYRSYTTDIVASGLHLLEIINDILDISAIEAGKATIEKEAVKIDSLVNSVLTLVRDCARLGGVALRVDLETELRPVMADPRRLKQVLLNLLTNAVKFTPSGGSVTLKAFASNPDGGLVFQIADTGVGMDEAGLAKAMQPFGQVDGGLNRMHEGTGLGLPLTRALIELHGGSLALESALGRGTTVSVYLPKMA
ncbi:MAG: PAS domain S-box protein [Rhodospirillales bacterium]|nr:PAS domain S-box protein [Rhodospirillales bacterium]